MKKLEIGQKVWCLYVNLTAFYISFKVEEGKYLGNDIKGLDKHFSAVEHKDDEVNYMSDDDIFKTEKDAIKELIKMLERRVK